MYQKILYALWAFLFSLCAGLGFIPEPAGALRIFCTTVSVLAFLPPALLLYRGEQQVARLIRNLSALSLLLTALLLVLNFLTVFGSETLGQILHDTLIIVSSPMICSGHWALSLFLWACLLVASRKKIRR